jgi:hypothetical protein
MSKPIIPNQLNSNSKDTVYLNEDLWYFDTDSGETVGPFRYKSEAESNLTRFLAQLQNQLGVKS